MKVLIIIALLFMACSKSNSGHTCRWELCPYKGIEQQEYNDAVRAYTGENNEHAAFKVDMLHLQHPIYEYDELEILLTN